MDKSPPRLGLTGPAPPDYTPSFKRLLFQFPSPIGEISSLLALGDSSPETVTCLVEQEGFLRLQLRDGVVLDIAPILAVRMRNTRQGSSIALSACTTQTQDQGAD